MPWFESIADLRQQADIIRSRRYGVIEAVDERLLTVRLRPWPKMVSLAEVWWSGARYHRRAQGNRCLLYYNQPWGHDRFLAVKYILSSRATTLKTVRCALAALDEIARLKQTDAIIAEMSNPRISDRLLQRWDWERHLPGSRRRHFIKRFYGAYPTQEAALSQC